MTQWQSGRVEVSGGYLAYHRTGGNQPVLVLAHGLTDNGLCWSRVTRELEADYDVVMLDARGHGGSSRIKAGEVVSPATDIREATEQLGLEAVLLMGHSVGARAMAMFANEYPDKARKLVLEDPPLLAPAASPVLSAKRLAGFAKQVEKFRLMTEAEIVVMGRQQSHTWHEDEFPAWAASKKQVDAGVVGNLQFGPWQETIDRITAPTLLVYGDADKGGMVTRELADEAHAINANITPAHIEGAGHNVRRENFASYMASVRTFLGS